MAIIRIDNPKQHTHGWQARWPVAPGSERYLSRMCSDKQHGGIDGAYGHALQAEQALKRRARRSAR